MHEINMATFDFDQAMCVYLGGPSDTRAIQIGNRDERLNAAFGVDAPEIKAELDSLLEAITKPAMRHGLPDGHSITSWIAVELPGLSGVCRQKIASHVLYQLEH
jgi:hypothetical protein